MFRQGSADLNDKAFLQQRRTILSSFFYSFLAGLLLTASAFVGMIMFSPLIAASVLSVFGISAIWGAIGVSWLAFSLGLVTYTRGKEIAAVNEGAILLAGTGAVYLGFHVAVSAMAVLSCCGFLAAMAGGMLCGLVGGLVSACSKPPGLPRVKEVGADNLRVNGMCPPSNAASALTSSRRRQQVGSTRIVMSMPRLSAANARAGLDVIEEEREEENSISRNESPLLTIPSPPDGLVSDDTPTAPSSRQSPAVL